MSKRVMLLAVMLLTTGCDWFLGLKEGVAAFSDGGAGGEAGAAGDGGGGAAGMGGMGDGGDAGGSNSTAANSGGMGPVCEEVPFTVFAEADTVIIEGDCNGANYYGGTPYGNIGVGRGLFRFPLDDAMASALHDGRMVELSMVLSRDFECLGVGNNCPAAAGSVSARPLRNDWVEGPYTYTVRGGADYCRRGSGSAGPTWQQPGAEGVEDSGGVSGSAMTSAADAAVTLSLDPEMHRPFVDARAPAPALSVMVVPDETVVFVVATKEELEPLEPPARLDGVYCKPAL